MTIKEIKPGTYFTLKPIEFPTAKQVWVRSSYDRSSKTYSAFRYDDVCSERFLKPNTVVYTEFYF